MLIRRYPQNAPRRFRSKCRLLGLSVFAVIISVSQAMACGVCTAGLIDRILPPVGLWSLFAVVWCLALACVVRLRRERVSGVPSVIVATSLVLALGMIGLMGFGPIGLLMLLWSPLRVAVQTFVGKARQHWSKPLARDLKIVTVGGLVVFASLSAYSVYIQLVRSPAEYALEWEHTAPGKMALADLVGRGQEALPDLRHLVAHGKPAMIARFAPSIAAFGQPATDVPLLILALGRCRGSGACEADVNAALRQLSGLDQIGRAHV